MGVIKHFSSSYFECASATSSVAPKSQPQVADPKNYRILRHQEVGSSLLLEVLYPGCTSYEGRKILLFSGVTLDQLKEQKIIDPHFSSNTKYHSPVARFEPTARGWVMGMREAQFLDSFK